METKTIRYYRPELEAAIDQKIKLIEQRIPIVSVAYAEKKQPPLSNEDIGPFFKEFHMQYQEVFISINESLQTNNLEANRSKDNEQTKRDIAELQNQLTMAQEQALHKGENTARKLKAPFQPVRLYGAWSVVGVLSLYEGLMNRPSFSAWGYNLIEAIGMSIAFAALLAILAHTFERIVRKGKTPWQQRAIAIGLLLFLAIIFWYLAEVRANYLSTVVTENTGAAASFSPIPFTLLSMLLFIASVATCHFLLPTREQREIMREYQSQREAERKIPNKVTQLEAAIEAKRVANEEMNRMYNSLQEYGAMLEQRIITHAKHGLELWKKHNFLHRTDGRPKSFDNEYSFEFKTFFHHVNLL
ncbi:hypothetical protein HDF24_11465 [Mucilaginibacter sp. X4EP1]|uniref:hypothetical protein n=1 Tax=Mucilaginibacter sp. X4EP1 TaxID=2723092 RepID=UPI002168D850|nr:hypothetical protein [Mucilaginibacter sp. X4EP1]MCS3816626.1 hypothetical protein [Mucilaginibacter sp. X4EP1]